jgi:hypothetical protein
LSPVAITGDPNAKMQYAQYVQRVVKVYNVGIIGWTHRTFASPSCLSEGESEIQKLFNAILNDSCKFIKFSTEEERAMHIKEHEDTIRAGQMVLVQKKAKGKGKAKQSDVIDEDEETMDMS